MAGGLVPGRSTAGTTATECGIWGLIERGFWRLWRRSVAGISQTATEAPWRRPTQPPVRQHGSAHHRQGAGGSRPEKFREWPVFEGQTSGCTANTRHERRSRRPKERADWAWPEALPHRMPSQERNLWATRCRRSRTRAISWTAPSLHGKAGGHRHPPLCSCRSLHCFAGTFTGAATAFTPLHRAARVLRASTSAVADPSHPLHVAPWPLRAHAGGPSPHSIGPSLPPLGRGGRRLSPPPSGPASRTRSPRYACVGGRAGSTPSGQTT